MPDLNYVAIPVAVVAAIFLSGAWYGALGAQLASLHHAYAEPRRTGVATVLVEMARNAVLTLVVAGLAAKIEIASLADGLLMGLVLWVGFPLILLAGSVFHEKVPPRLAAIHAGELAAEAARHRGSHRGLAMTAQPFALGSPHPWRRCAPGRR